MMYLFPPPYYFKLHVKVPTYISVKEAAVWKRVQEKYYLIHFIFMKTLLRKCMKNQSVNARF